MKGSAVMSFVGLCGCRMDAKGHAVQCCACILVLFLVEDGG